LRNIKQTDLQFLRKYYDDVSTAIDKKFNNNDEYTYLFELNEKLQAKIKRTEGLVSTLEKQVADLDQLNNQIVRNCYTGTVHGSEPRPRIQ
jgi:hypothetical protein